MYLFNPLQPGSVYTDILADGAVTLVKTDFETNPLPVAAGGTGSSNPSPAATAPLTLTGTWPNQTVALTTPLSVADGGTGTATPTITAGNNITVTGTWPNVTVALDATLAVANIIATPTTITTGFDANVDLSSDMAPRHWFNNSAGTASYGGMGLATDTGRYSNDAAINDVIVRSDNGSVRILHGATATGIEVSGTAVNINLPIGKLDGESLTGPGVPGIVASFQGTAQATVDVITFTPSADGYYRITAWVHRAPGGTTDNADVEVFYYPPDDSTEQISFDPIPTTSIAAGSALDGQGSFYAASGTEIDVRVGDADTTNYSAHFRIVVEYLGS